MGVVQLPDEMHRAIEQEVAQGRAITSTAFVEEAVRRLLEDLAEDGAIERAVEDGSPDIQAGRFTTILSEADEAALRDRVLTRLQDILGLVHDRMALSRAVQRIVEAGG